LSRALTALRKAKSQPGLALADSKSSFQSGVLADRLQAARADILANFAAFFEEVSPLDIGLELPLRLLLRKAHVLSKLWALATEFTFGHNFTST
jgi:hypothetical protein